MSGRPAPAEQKTQHAGLETLPDEKQGESKEKGTAEHPKDEIGPGMRIRDQPHQGVHGKGRTKIESKRFHVGAVVQIMPHLQPLDNGDGELRR